MNASCSNMKTSAENLHDNTQCVKLDRNPKVAIVPVIEDTEAHLLDIDMREEQKLNKKGRWKFYGKYCKFAIIILIWIVCCYVLMAKHVTVQEGHQISIPKNNTKAYIISEIPAYGKLWLRLEGALLPQYYSNLSSNSLYTWVEFITLMNPLKNHTYVQKHNILLTQNVSEVWKIPLVTEDLISIVPEVKQKHEFNLSGISVDPLINAILRINFRTNLKTNLPLSLTYNIQPINADDGIIYAVLILLFLYILIISEVIHRTLAAMLVCTMSIAILAILDARPSMAEIVSWVDIETLLLLFSMMTLVTIFSETGIFDYTAVLAYKLTRGKEWPLINCLCFLTAILSCFLDNVTTGLLMTPVTIRLCEVTKLNPIPVLISMIIFSNIGGAITPIGDPPNVIIASNPDVIKSGINFTSFIVHMGVGIILVSIFTYLQLRYFFRNIKDLRFSAVELEREIAVWQKAAECLSSYSHNEEVVKETLKKRSTRLLGKLNTKPQLQASPSNNYENNLENLIKKYPIKDKTLLIKCSCILFFVITLFFLHSVPEISSLSLGLTAFLGALILLVLYDRDKIESVFARVEWSTLLFFASLFVIMEALAQLGLIEWIGKKTQYVIMSVRHESRLAVAILLILWVSGVASAFVDNIPLTTMMIKIATALADDIELQLPLQPLIWALSFGACFGGNGTLFGSSSNIVCAGVAEQHGYRISFMQFLKIGFPIMITSLIVISVYLIVVHVVLQWN